MRCGRYAAIDIGTVTCRMLVVDVGESGLHELTREYAITNLGEGVDATGELKPEAIDRVVRAIDGFLAVRDSLSTPGHPVIRTVAVATSATSAARRRGLEITRTSPWARPASSRPLAIMVPSCLTALFSGAEGISSVPISNRKSLASAMAYATSPSWSAFSLTPATSAM